MKSHLFTAFLLLTYGFAQSQNVGIGTTSPASKLHITGPDSGSGNTNVMVDAVSPAAFSSLNLRTTNSIVADLTRFGASSGGSFMGISANNLTRLYNNIGPLALAAGGKNNLYFGTNTTVRMQIDSLGLIGVNDAPFSLAQMHLMTGLDYGLHVENTRTTTQAEAVSGRIVHFSGAAVSGIADVSGLGYAGYEAASYGVRGIAGNSGIGGGFFNGTGTALRARSNSGLALSTTGSLRFTGIGEATNRVLTSDASGSHLANPALGCGCMVGEWQQYL